MEKEPFDSFVLGGVVVIYSIYLFMNVCAHAFLCLCLCACECLCVCMCLGVSECVSVCVLLWRYLCKHIYCRIRRFMVRPKADI